MWLILFLIAGLFILLGAGCRWISLNEPRLGQYQYTQLSVYEGIPVRVIPIWVDKKFGSADRLAIDDAVSSWNYALNGYIKLQIVDFEFDYESDKVIRQIRENGWFFLLVNHDNSLIPKNDKGYLTIGFTELIGGHHLYLVRDRLSNEMVYGVTMHEIGHLLGAEHLGTHLMYPHYTRARFQCIDLRTIWAVAVYNNLPADRLNYCVDLISSNSSSEVTKNISDSEASEPTCPLGPDPP